MTLVFGSGMPMDGWRLFATIEIVPRSDKNIEVKIYFAEIDRHSPAVDNFLTSTLLVQGKKVYERQQRIPSKQAMNSYRGAERSARKTTRLQRLACLH